MTWPGIIAGMLLSIWRAVWGSRRLVRAPELVTLLLPLLLSLVLEPERALPALELALEVNGDALYFEETEMAAVVSFELDGGWKRL